jgi:hypothetical protein
MLMGVLNVTPDSFSDGGDHFTVEAAVAVRYVMDARPGQDAKCAGRPLCIWISGRYLHGKKAMAWHRKRMFPIGE